MTEPLSAMILKRTIKPHINLQLMNSDPDSHVVNASFFVLRILVKYTVPAPGNVYGKTPASTRKEQNQSDLYAPSHGN